MSGQVIPFPPRGPFVVTVSREAEADAWIVISRDHGWLFGSRTAARAEAKTIARGFGVAVVEIRS